MRRSTIRRDMTNNTCALYGTRQTARLAFLVVGAFLFALNVGAGDAQLFAITKAKLTGPKGAIRLTQVLFVPKELGEAECRDLLRGPKEADRRRLTAGG